MQPLIVYWSRRDLRIQDNPALTAALRAAQAMNAVFIPLYIVEPYMKKDIAYIQRLFLRRAVPALLNQFPHAVRCTGTVTEVFTALQKKYALHIFVNEDVHPDFYAQVNKLQQRNITITVLPDQLSIAKNVVSGKGTMYSVFTPFKNAVWDTFVSLPVLPAPDLTTVTYCTDTLPHTITPEVFQTIFSSDTHFSIDGVTYQLPHVPTLDGWYITEAEAMSHFNQYVDTQLRTYKKERDFLSSDAPSKMSSALAWGLVSARMLVSVIRSRYSLSLEGPQHYISELIWREFYKYLLYHTPSLLTTEFQERFRNRIEWVSGDTAHARFSAWIHGTTGYPVVDAAMHQIAHTGWMHNRARMIVASVLTKNLGINWRWGQAYFEATLLDLDEASNNGGWQWAASVGADPKPIRIFNPYLQAKKYDADNRFQKQWLPESYVPVPIIEHVAARKEALIRYGLGDTGVRDY